MKIPLADWKCSKTERKYVNKVLSSGWITYGPFCKALEEKWASYHNNKYGVISSSGTAALQLAFRALKEKYGLDSKDEVICPAITFPATINMVIESGLTPILADVEKDGTISLDSVKKKVTHKTRILCLVHLWGVPHKNTDEIIKYCRDNGILIVEDSCETIDKKVGAGDISCFSMYFNHIISAGVGGMSCTNDKDLELLMRSLANHGMKDVNVNPKYKRFRFKRVGYSFRVTEMEAALGLAQFENIDNILSGREKVYSMLISALKEYKVMDRITAFPGRMMLPIVFSSVSGAGLISLHEYLNEKGIETREMMPITNQDVYLDLVPNYEEYPAARWINNHGMFLPINTKMKERDCRYIARHIAKWYKKSNYTF